MTKVPPALNQPRSGQRRREASCGRPHACAGATLRSYSFQVTPVELSRAKNQLASSLLMNLESRPVLFEDIGRQVLSYGARTPAEDLVAQINAVTEADLAKTAQALLASPPSVAVYGDTTSLPRYDVIARHFAK